MIGVVQVVSEVVVDDVPECSCNYTGGSSRGSAPGFIVWVEQDGRVWQGWRATSNVVVKLDSLGGEYGPTCQANVDRVLSQEEGKRKK